MARKILVTNDDGIDAPGIAALAKVAEAFGEVTVVAPDRAHSGCGHRVTTDEPIHFNEIAPRPHNSGHYTIDACITSQFEQQVRAVCGLSLGDPTQVRPAAMVNLLGDLWVNGEPDWAAALAVPGVSLHLVGGHTAGLQVVSVRTRRRMISVRIA